MDSACGSAVAYESLDLLTVEPGIGRVGARIGALRFAFAVRLDWVLVSRGSDARSTCLLPALTESRFIPVFPSFPCRSVGTEQVFIRFGRISP